MNATKNIKVSTENLISLFGPLDEYARLVERGLGVRLYTSDGELVVEGEEESVRRADELYSQLISLIGKGYPVTKERVKSAIDLVLEDKPDDIVALSTEVVAVTARGKFVRCKTVGQRHYANMIKKNALTFGVGPAGTGKTYLAVAMAVAAYKAGEVQRIILTRPAIEAGEKLGFLPGDLQEKVDPYLRPLYDALSELFGVDNYETLIERGIVEIAPLAYMRGRTLSDAFVILDEAQNTTEEQMKMFLTRMGENSKMVVNGDLTQIDLPKGSSGLAGAVKILNGIEGIAVCTLTEKDVVRHELVQRIVQAYAHAREEKNGKED